MKTKKINEQVTYWLGVVSIGLIFGLSLQFVQAWTEPTVAPPGGNVGAPMNTSNIGQTKAGGLMLNTGGATNGLIVDKGNVGIGTSSPQAELHVKGSVPTSGSEFAAGAEILIDDDEAILQLAGQSGQSHIIFSSTDNNHWGLTHWGNTTVDGYTHTFSIGKRAGLPADWDFGNWWDWDNYLNILSDGRVGIGTTSPQETLHIKGNGEMILEDSSVGIEFRDTNNDAFAITASVGNLDFEAFDGSWDTSISIHGSGVTETVGGLIIETRTDDPVTPADGRMWLRTDL